MTLPQAIYMWVMGRESIGRDRQMQLVLLRMAIASAFGGKDSKHAFSSLMSGLAGEDMDIGVDLTKLSEGHKLFLLGKSRMGGGDGAPEE